SVLEEMEARLSNSREGELRTALEQIGHIARARLKRIIREG
ncbi:MAG: OHCU decarboxylase, partial [Betaproteobacteria bacterium]|nr:OHCU decarboxylase [Betaproteobacteria bacterium]MBV9362579.1 OHCU decarboxylase [Betaproteobacteria bacterium]